MELLLEKALSGMEVELESRVLFLDRLVFDAFKWKSGISSYIRILQVCIASWR